MTPHRCTGHDRPTPEESGGFSFGPALSVESFDELGTYHTGRGHGLTRGKPALSLVESPIGDPTGNRSGVFSLGTSAASVDPTHLAFEEHTWRHRTPKPDIVIAIAWVVVVAVRSADVVPIVVPGAPAQHFFDLPPRRGGWLLSLISSAVCVPSCLVSLLCALSCCASSHR